MITGRTKAPKYIQVHDIRILFSIEQAEALLFVLFLQLQAMIISQGSSHEKKA